MASYNQEEICEQRKLDRYEELNPKVMVLVYSVIFLLSVVGNSIVIFVMCFRVKTRSVTSMLISNLAVSDLMLCFTSLWITPAYYYLQTWPLGDVMCHLLPMCQSASVFNSSLTLLAISIERYFTVCRSEQTSRRIFSLTPKSCTFLILLIWFISISLSIPYSTNMHLVQRECGLRCAEQWSGGNEKANHEIRILYGFAVMIIQFAVPFCFIGSCYLKIYLYVQRQINQSCFRLRVVSTKKSTLFRMLLVMVTAFAMSWLPLNIINVMRDLHLSKFIQPFTRYFMICHVIAMTATIMNPLIYAFMNITFRDELARITPELHVFGKLLFCRKRSNCEKPGNPQQLERPLLDLNNGEHVSLKGKKNGKAEICRHSSNNSQEKACCSKSILANETVSTNETTPNHNSPIDL